MTDVINRLEDAAALIEALPTLFEIADEDRPRDIPSDVVFVMPIGAYSIFEVVRDAACVANLTDLVVALDFNNLRVIVRPGSDPSIVARDWWRRAYGETPEESLRRR